ncbi:MAG: hypothetical protein IJW28_02865 [Clostridia bacterium]|nr:hypothetical protein [Clostridia bacterium]
MKNNDTNIEDIQENENVSEDTYKEESNEAISDTDTLTKRVPIEESHEVAEDYVPPRHFFNMNMQRIGEITSNLALFLACIIPFGLLGIIILPMAMIMNLFIAIMIVVFTLGLIFLHCSFGDLLIVTKAVAEGNWSEIIFSLMYYSSWAMMVMSVISTLAFLCNKRNRSVGRIVGNVFIFLFGLVVIVLSFMS